MFPVVNQNQTEQRFWDQFLQLPAAIESKIPTFDKSLDVYFDTSFASIIEEWDLLTDTDLHKLETRLSRVTSEISTLYAEKMVLERRVESLDYLISTLEKSA
jgi:hypothetical protein